MTNKKSIRRAVLSSALALILCFTSLIGTTFAWFTDEVTSGRNLIVAGNLDVDLDYMDDNGGWKDIESATDLFKDSLWEPGKVQYVNLKVANVGTLALNYKLMINFFGENCVLDEQGQLTDLRLSDVIKVAYVEGGVEVTGTEEEQRAAAIKLGEESSAGFGDIETMMVDGRVYPKDNADGLATEVQYGVILYWAPNDNETDNKYNLNNDKFASSITYDADGNAVEHTTPTEDELFIELGVKLEATQLTYENDSFGNKYDMDAWEEMAQDYETSEDGSVIYINNAPQLAQFALDIANGGTSFKDKTVSITADIDLSDRIWTPINAWAAERTGTITINGNGNSIIGMTVNSGSQAGFIGSFSGGKLVINDLIFEDADVTTSGSFAGVVIGYQYGDVTLNNVDVVDSTVNTTASAGIRIGGLVGLSAQNDGAKLTFDECDVTDTTISGYHNVGGFVGSTASDAPLNINNSTSNATILYSATGGVGGHKFGAGLSGYTSVNVSATTNNVENSLVLGKHAESSLYWNGNAAAFKGVYYIFNADDLKKAADYFVNQTKTNESNKVTIELMADIDLAGKTWTPWSVMWIDLNGNDHTISNVTTAEGWRSGLFGYIGAATINDLTLENINSTGAQAGTFAGSVEGVTINNSFLKGTNTVTYKEYKTDSYTETWGGIGAVTGIVASSTINVEIESGATVTVAKNAMTTEATYVDNLTGYLQANKGTVTNNGNVTVKSTVATLDTLEDALANGDDVTLEEDVDADAPVVMTGGTFDGNGKVLEADSGTSDYESGLTVQEGTVENITVKDAFRGLGVGGSGQYEMTGDVYYKNVTVTGATYGINIGVGNGHKLFVSDSTICDWNSYSGLSGAEFTNCTFTSEGHYYAAQRISAGATFTYTNCEFEQNTYDNASGTENYYLNSYNGTGTIVLDNCTMNGVQITAENVNTLFQIKDVTVTVK